MKVKLRYLGWNNSSGKVSVVIPSMNEKKATKKNILSELSSVYDPISLIFPAHLLGKLLSLKICDLKLPWNEAAPPLIKK